VLSDEKARCRLVNDAGSSPTAEPVHLTRVAKIELVATAAALLFNNGQTTERVVLSAERLGHALGTPLRLHPHWGELALQIGGTPFSEMIPAMPLGVDMRKVLTVTTVVDHVCDGTLAHEEANAALTAAGRLPPVSTLRFTVFATLGGIALGVIFGALDMASLLLIALAAATGALVRRWLARLGHNPFVQPLCAAAVAGVVGAIDARFNLSQAHSLVALCPCMLLVPGPHILNGAIDLARARVTLGIARLVYASLIVLMICIGLLAALAAGGTTVPADTTLSVVPFAADVLAAGMAVAAFGTFFAMPLRLMPFAIIVGMIAHSARWALIVFGGAHVTIATLVASLVIGIIVTPVADRLRLPFAALAFSAVVPMMPGYFLFHATGALVALVSVGSNAPASLLASVVANGATAFLIILAMTVGLILPRMLYEYFLPAGRRATSVH